MDRQKSAAIEGAKSGVVKFSDLEFGDRFYFMNDKKKKVFEITSAEPVAYQMDTERHARIARPSDANKSVYLLRNKNS